MYQSEYNITYQSTLFVFLPLSLSSLYMTVAVAPFMTALQTKVANCCCWMVLMISESRDKDKFFHVSVLLSAR